MKNNPYPTGTGHRLSRALAHLTRWAKCLFSSSADDRPRNPDGTPFHFDRWLATLPPPVPGRPPEPVTWRLVLAVVLAALILVPALALGAAGRLGLLGK
jgi:hypothetical protein